MPIMKCSENGKSGFKYGESGHCYTGKNAKKMAIKQMLAIKHSGYTEGSEGEYSTEEYDLLMSDNELTDLDKLEISLAYNQQNKS